MEPARKGRQLDRWVWTQTSAGGDDTEAGGCSGVGAGMDIDIGVDGVDVVVDVDAGSAVVRCRKRADVVVELKRPALGRLAT